MARALLGHVGAPGEQLLAFEVARLRRRVDELETEVARLRASKSAELDLELHHFTQSGEFASSEDAGELAEAGELTEAAAPALA